MYPTLWTSLFVATHDNIEDISTSKTEYNYDNILWNVF